MLLKKSRFLLILLCGFSFNAVVSAEIQTASPKEIQAQNPLVKGDSKALPYRQFNDHTVYFTVFPSSFIPAKVASTYGLTRGSDRALINISISKNSVGSSSVDNSSVSSNKAQGLGQAAKITGTATNLMQQQYTLEFIEIQEQDAVYYLAPFRFINEEVMHFNLNISIDQQHYPLTFTKKLYVD
jgi:hypothetical protein